MSWNVKEITEATCTVQQWKQQYSKFHSSSQIIRMIALLPVK